MIYGSDYKESNENKEETKDENENEEETKDKNNENEEETKDENNENENEELATLDLNGVNNLNDSTIFNVFNKDDNNVTVEMISMLVLIIQ